MPIYDGNGNPIEIGSAIEVVDPERFVDNDGMARAGNLEYDTYRFYPKVYTDQIERKVKMYDGGVLLALGDSYTAMAGTEFTAFAQTHGLVCDNLGYGSSTIAGTTDGTVGYHPFWSRLDAEIANFPKAIDGTTYALSDVKLITFMGGANDWWTVNESVDRLGDSTSTDKAQLWGATKYIFDTFQTTFPNADVIVILQPSNAGSETSNYAMWLKEGIIRECAEMYSLPICDCRFDWYNPVNPSDLATYWSSDNVHLSNLGEEKLFEKLEKTLNSLQFYRAS